MPNPSPLRYPGGKNRLAGFISLVIQNLNLPNYTYIEPFAVVLAWPLLYY